MIGSRSVEGWGVLERAVDLARSGEAFVLATVVWREGPTSGQHGARAIYTAGGDMYGWIGGACAEPVFIREARETLEAGVPRLLALGTSERFGDLPQGTTAVAMSCQSEGALQLYLEPVVPMPHLVVVGSSPLATTLADVAGSLDWHVELVDGPDFSEGLLSERSAVVVATQGHGDEDLLVAVAKATPAYVGVIASAKRGASLRDHLIGQGVEESQVDAMRIPAGLDLGKTTHKEVAVAVLAELVQRRAAGDFVGAVVDVAPPETAIDPICGMTVEISPNAPQLAVGDEVFYFCCPGCRTVFERDQEGA